MGKKEKFTPGPWNVRASDLPESERYCTCCARPLSAAARMLEHDQRYNVYHDFGGVPKDRSQGWFVFGLTCSRMQRRIARAALSKVSSTQRAA